MRPLRKIYVPAIRSAIMCASRIPNNRLYSNYFTRIPEVYSGTILFLDKYPAIFLNDYQNDRFIYYTVGRVLIKTTFFVVSKRKIVFANAF